MNNAQADALAEANRCYFQNKLSSGEFVAFLAEVDGQIVGTSGLVLFEKPPTPGNIRGMEAYALDIYTTPDWRGRGIATALAKEAICSAQEVGARVWLRAMSEDGRRIYERLGFVGSHSYMELRS